MTKQKLLDKALAYYKDKGLYVVPIEQMGMTQEQYDKAIIRGYLKSEIQNAYKEMRNTTNSHTWKQNKKRVAKLEKELRNL